MLSRPLRVIHRCIERIIVFKMKILNIYFCYLRVALYLDRGTNFAWEMDSFSRRRLKYNFPARKLRTACLQVSRFDRRLFGYKNDSYEPSIESVERYMEKHVFPFNGIERKKGRNLNIRSEFYD